MRRAADGDASATAQEATPKATAQTATRATAQKATMHDTPHNADEASGGRRAGRRKNRIQRVLNVRICRSIFKPLNQTLARRDADEASRR